MMSTNTPPIPHDSVYWYTLKEPIVQKLMQSETADVVVVGGGMSGLTTAQQLRDKGLSVIVLEKDFCGSGGTGKSSGFITPESELGPQDLIDLFGEDTAQQIWELGTQGVRYIKKNIETYSISCDYAAQDSLFVANTQHKVKDIEQEYAAFSHIGKKAQVYNHTQLQEVIGSSSYYGGVRYGDTFSICAYLYCQRMRSALQEQGVKIFEHTPVVRIDGNVAYTDQYVAKAQHIVICVDYHLPDFNIIPQDVYHAQTFIAVSKPVDHSVIQRLFPSGSLMVWDTDLIYQYYRVLDNNRFLIGGGQLLSTYATHENHHAKHVFNKLNNYAQRTFPYAQFEFEYFWPALIGISKNLVPIAGQDTQNPCIYYISGVAGLPWAAAVGVYIADKITSGRSELDHVFNSSHNHPIRPWMQKIIGKRLAFALGNGIVKFFY